VYAWYFTPSVAQFDLDAVLSRLARLDDGPARVSAVSEFLSEHLLRFFRETPYQVCVSGQLKPRYEGEIAHHQDVSRSLAERIAEDPDRLRVLRQVLEVLAPQFTAPLYIGMATNLQRRLRQHKRLIEGYLENRGPGIAGSDATLQRDHSFAHEVYSRRMSTSSLSVVILPFDGLADVVVDVEHLLNRINYPIYGRN